MTDHDQTLDTVTLALRQRAIEAARADRDRVIEEASHQLRELGLLNGDGASSTGPGSHDLAEWLGSTVDCLLLMAEQPERIEELFGLVRDHARGLAGDGLPLPTILLAYQFTARALWEIVVTALTEAADDRRALADALSRLSLELFSGFGILQHEAALGYLGGDQGTIERHNRLRRSLREELLTAPHDRADGLRELVSQTDLKLGERHAVAVATFPQAPDADHVSALTGRHAALGGVASALSAVVVGSGTPILHQRGMTLVAIFPVGKDTAESTVHSALTTALNLNELSVDGSVVVGLGGVHDGIESIPRSYRQALRAIEAAKAGGPGSRVVSYAEALPTLMLMQDRQLAGDLSRMTIEPLQREDEYRGTDLLRTLAAYLDEPGDRDQLAASLEIEPSELDRRLARIEDLTAQRLSDHRALLLFKLGLCGQGLGEPTPAHRARTRAPADPARASANRPGRAASGR